MARRGWALIGLGLALLGLGLWALGLLDGATDAVRAGQRAVQDRMAGAVRALRTGQPGALAGLLGLGFAYGFFHAAGPGHGKMLIGGYGMARRVPLLRLSAIALLASLAQAGVAVALVYGFIAVLDWTRDRVEGLAERVLDPLGLIAVLAIGVWLMWRGGRGLARQRPPAGRDHHHDHHHHDHGADCGCGHAHGPTPDQVAAVTGWRDGAALVAGIALRPCSGALFLLILTWKMGIGAAGIAGTFAMGLGTALVTIAVAIMAVWTREGVLATLPGAGLARALPVIELLVGGVVALIATRMLVLAI
jgi:ABC-type nickel/cobalt efflux system permease component RcnA